MLWIWSLIFKEEKALSLFLKVGKAQHFDEPFFLNWFSLVEHMLLNQTNLSSKWPYVTDTNWCFVFCVLVVTMRRFVLHDGSFYCEICQSLWKCQPVAKKLEFESSTLKQFVLFLSQRSVTWALPLPVWAGVRWKTCPHLCEIHLSPVTAGSSKRL